MPDPTLSDIDFKNKMGQYDFKELQLKVFLKSRFQLLKVIKLVVAI